MGEEAGEVARAGPRGIKQVSVRFLFQIQTAMPSRERADAGNEAMRFAYWEGHSSCSTGVGGMGQLVIQTSVME